MLPACTLVASRGRHQRGRSAEAEIQRAGGVHWNALTLLLVTVGAACVQSPEPVPVGSHAQRLAYMDSLRYYEMEVPLDADFQRIRDSGVGLFPSAARHPEAEGWWAVALLDDRGVETALDFGLDPRPAPRAALDSTFLEALDAAAAARGEATDAALAREPGTDAPQPRCDLRGRWCQYEGDEGCGDGFSILDQIVSLAQDNPGWAELAWIGPTGEGNIIWGLRVGVLSDQANDPQHPVDQLVVFATQHANEWAGTGMVMDLAKAAIADINDSEWYQSVMSTRSILFVPVVNPDGYEYAFSASGDRMWRRNRQLCTEEPDLGPCGPGGSCTNGACNPVNNRCYRVGVDPNRNFAYSWRNRVSCSDQTYQGAAAGTAAETGLLDRLIRHQSLPGSFATRVYVNYHAYGSYLLYADGLSADAQDGLLHNPCRMGDFTLSANCQPPEFGVLRALGSDSPGLETTLRDEYGGGYYYTADTVWRALYAAPGDQLSHHGYSYSIPDAQRALGLSIEVTNNANGFYAECMDEGFWDFLVDDHRNFTWGLAYQLDNVASASAAAGTYGYWLMPRIHRILPDDEQPSTYDYGPPKFYVDYSTTFAGNASIAPINFPNPGTSGSWGVRGLFYRTAKWWNTVRPFVFPRQFRACADGACQDFQTDGAPELDLCSAAVFTQSNGWTWTPNNQQQGVKDCYMRVSSTGQGPFNLVRRAGSMAGADRVHLNYSYRIAPGAFDSLNGRVNVYVEAPGRTTRRVRTYPHRVGEVGINMDLTPNDLVLRSENVLLPAEYANTAGITVRFAAKWIKPNYGGYGFAFEVYDVALVGRDLP